jgi:hypothetical protein
MNRYHNGKIYKLVNTVDDRIYIGSTATELSKRLYKHKIDSRKTPERKVYKELNTIGWEHVRIIQIEVFRCETKQELLTREQHFIDLLKPDLNKNSATGIHCIHNRQRYSCVECGGSAVCSHNKQRSQCIECGGSAMCSHNKQRPHCIECGGNQICEHNKQRSQCIPCGGSSMCIHNKYKNTCIPCGGSALCSHNKRRIVCVECSPAICELCDITTSKGSFKKHLKTDKHKNMVLLSAVILFKSKKIEYNRKYPFLL